MRIKFDESTLKQQDNASRSITGLVCFEFDGRCFPGDGWDDFVVVIAAWWLHGVTELQRGIRGEVELRFMDGPYWITATRATGDIILLKCIEDRSDAGMVHEERVELTALVAEVHCFAQKVASACARRGMGSNDVSLLREALPG